MAQCDLQPHFLREAHRLGITSPDGTVLTDKAQLKEVLYAFNQSMREQMLIEASRRGAKVSPNDLTTDYYFDMDPNTGKLYVTKAGQRFMNDYLDSATTVNSPQDPLAFDESIPDELLESGMVIEEEERLVVENNLAQPLPMHYDRLLAHTNMLISSARDELQQIDTLIKRHRNEKEIVKELLKRRNSILERLNGSPKKTGLLGLQRMLKSQKPSLFNLRMYFDDDMRRVSHLLSTRKPEDLKEAGRIVDFYISLGTFDVNRPHVLFDNSEIYTETGQNKLPADVVKLLTNLREKAEKFKITIDMENRKQVRNIINMDPRVEMMYGRELTNEEIFYTARGLKDINFVDMLIMDVTNGIFSKGHIIPQSMMAILAEGIDRFKRESNQDNKRIDELSPLVEERLEALGFKVKGMFVKGVVYDLFRAKDKNGNFTDNFVQRFTQEFLSLFKSKEEQFAKDITALEMEEDEVKREEKRRKIFKKYRNFLSNNTVIMRPQDIPELRDDENLKEIFENRPPADPKHKEELIAILGEKGYQAMVEEQRAKLESYKIRKELTYEKLLEEEMANTDSILLENNPTTLSPESMEIYRQWLNNNNPLNAAERFLEDSEDHFTAYEFNVFVPKREQTVRIKQQDGSYIEETRKTNFYDESFEVIENDDVLLEFHGLAISILDKVHEHLPPDAREKLGNSTTIPALKRNLTNILLDPHIHGLAKLSEAFRYILEKLKNLFTERFEEDLSYAHIDPLTGKPEYRVSTSWLKTNKSKIDTLLHVELMRMSQFIDKKSISPRGTVNLRMVPEEVLFILAENLGCEPTVEAIQRRLPNSDISKFSIYNELRAGITHHTVQENTFDLPKVLKMYGNLAAVYGARQQALPILTLMKHYYEQISKASTGPRGSEMYSAIDRDENGNPMPLTDGLRSNAIRAMDSWFHRAVLGNYNTKNELGNTTIGKRRRDGEGLTPDEEREEAKTLIDRLKNFTGRISNRVLTREEKLMEKRLDEARRIAYDNLENAVSEEQRNYLQHEIDFLDRQRNQLGGQVTLTGIFDALLNLCRIKGLGWNYKSALTNWGEGQISNMQTATSGLYFEPENIYRANAIVRKSLIKLASGDRIRSKEARKLRALMDRFDVLQDSSNELQKASSKSPLNNLGALGAYELTRRIEYKNQAPLMIAILLDQKITDKNGENPVSVWDAMDEEGNLLEEYRTEENIATWEQCKTDTYRRFSTKVSKCIVNTHGDYHELRGNMASEYISGKVMLMFKRWLPRYFYSRFAVEQDDLEIGVRGYKGRYRSATSGTVGLAAGLIGFLTFGPVGMAIAGVGGIVVSKAFSPKHDLNLAQDLLYNCQGLLKALIRIPLNFTLSKNVIKHESDEQILRKFGRLDAEGNVKQEEGGFNSVDAKNFRANMSELAMYLFLIAVKLMFKALRDLDDGDEKDREMVGLYNLAINQTMQMSGQIEAMLSPGALYNNYASKVACWEQLNGMASTVGALSQKFSGNDLIMSGRNAGKSRFGVEAERAFFPFFKRLGPAMSMQYSTDYTDDPGFMWGAFTSKKKLRKIARDQARMKYRVSLADRGYSEKQINKMVAKRYKSEDRR